MTWNCLLFNLQVKLWSNEVKCWLWNVTIKFCTILLVKHGMMNAIEISYIKRSVKFLLSIIEKSFAKGVINESIPSSSIFCCLLTWNVESHFSIAVHWKLHCLSGKCSTSKDRSVVRGSSFKLENGLGSTAHLQFLWKKLKFLTIVFFYSCKQFLTLLLSLMLTLEF